MRSGRGQQQSNATRWAVGISSVGIYCRGGRVIALGNRYLKATTKVGVLTGATLLRLASLFAVTVLLGRSAGADALGSFSLLLAGAAILQSVSIGGLSGAAVHKLLVEHSNRNDAMALLVASRLFLIPLSFGIGGLVLLLGGIAQDVDRLALVIFIVGYAVGSFDVGELGSTARGRFLLMGNLRFCLIIVTTIPKLFLAADGNTSAVLIWQGIEAAAWQAVLVPASGLGTAVFRSARRSIGGGIRQVWDLRNLWLSNIMSSMAQRVDLFIVGAFLGQAGVGQYSTASRPVEAAVIVANSLMAVLFNGMVGASFRPFAYARSCQRNSRRVGLLGLLVTGLLAIAGPPILMLLYGQEFNEAAALLPIYACSLLFLFQRQFLSRILIIEKAYGLSLWSNLAMLASCVLLNVFLIPVMGLTGAALAAVLAHPSSLLMSMMLSRKGRRLLILSFGSLFLPIRSIRRVTYVAVFERQL